MSHDLILGFCIGLPVGYWCSTALWIALLWRVE